MEELDKLTTRVEADTKPLEKGLEKAEKATEKTSGRMVKAFRRVTIAVGLLADAIISLHALMLFLVGGAIIKAIQGIAQVNIEFQNLRYALDVVFGSIESGKAAFEFIERFALQTPFDIQTLSRTLIQLGGAGIKPTIELLNTMSDAASATVDKVAAFTTLTRIVARAAGGGLGLEEFEQLVVRGIPVYQILQEELGVTRKEITKLGQSAEGAAKLMEALLRGLDKRYGGATEKSLETLGVAASNMKIAFVQGIRALGDGVGGYGLTGAFTRASKSLETFFLVIQPIVRIIGTTLAGAVDLLVGALDVLSWIIKKSVTASLWVARKAVGLFGKETEIAGKSVEEMQDELKALEETMNQNITATTGMTEAEKRFESGIAAMNDQIKQRQALLYGLSKEEIKYLRQTDLWRAIDFDENGITYIAEAAKQGVNEVSTLTDRILALDAALEEQAAMGRYDQRLKDKTTTVKLLRMEVEGATEAQVALERIISRTGANPTDDQRATLMNILKQEDALRKKRKAQNDVTEAIKRGQEAERNRQWEIGDRIKNMEADNRLLTMSIYGQSEASLYLAEVEKELGTLTTEQAQNILDLRERYEELDAQLKSSAAIQNEFAKSMRQMGNNIANGLAEMLVEGKISLDSFLDVGKQFVKEMISSFVRLAVINRIMNSLFGGNLPTVDFSRFGGGAPAFGSGAHPGSRAGGGSVNMNTPHLVGERGPELFVPHSAGKIVPNGAMNAMGGGQSIVVNQTLNIETGVSQTVRAEMMSLLPVFAENAKIAVADEVRRGGILSNEIRG